jgi:alternate signal-mediated exported protein
MKKMTKGAIVTGLGVALLLGGGGTLAVWNDSADSTAGGIVAGDLELTDQQTGVWKSNVTGATISNIGSYKVVPGETLTYTQDLTVKLLGDQMVATLGHQGAGVDGGFGNNVTVSEPVLTNAKGKILPTTELKQADSGKVTATTTFVFKAETKDRDSVNATYNLGGVSYVLKQTAPVIKEG